MINKDRIVPVTKADLLSIYATAFNMIMALNGGAQAMIGGVAANDVEGNFTIDTSSLGGVLSQPVKSIAVDGEVDNFVCYFIPDYNFEEITIGGEIFVDKYDTEEIDPSSANLYLLKIASGTPSLLCVTPNPAE